MSWRKTLQLLFVWIDKKLKRHYQSPDIKKLIEAQDIRTLFEARAREQDLQPSFSVTVQFVRNPVPGDVRGRSRFCFTVENTGGETNLRNSSVRISYSQNEAYNQEKKIPKTKFPKTKHEDFFEVRTPIRDKVICGSTIAKFSYELAFEKPNGEITKQAQQATYNPRSCQFDWEPAHGDDDAGRLANPSGHKP